MALSEAMKKRIQNAAANQKSNGTTTAASGGGQSTGLSSAMKDRIRKSASMQQLGKEDPGVDEAFLKKFQNDYQKYVYDTQHARNTMTYQSSRDGSYEKRFGAVEKDLADRAKTIRTYLNLYKDSLDSETYKNLTDYMDQIDSVGIDIRKGYASMQDYFSQWETEDDYNAYVAWQKDYDEKAGYDVAAGRQEIEALEKQLADLRLQQTAASFGPRANRDNGAAQYAEQTRQLEQEIARKKQYANQSQYIQKGETLKGVTGNQDFVANSGYVSTIDENPAWGMNGVGDSLYEWINDRDGFRDTYEQNMARLNRMNGVNAAGTESPYYQKSYDRMTDQEVAIYNYYYATEGKEKAEEYLHSIQEQLNTRKATELFEGMQGKTGQELVFGVEAGLDQFQSGMQSLFNTEDDYIAQSTKQIASGMVREDLEDDSIPMWYNVKTGQWEQQILGSSAGQLAYDAITTSANMAPSILTSIAVGMINPVAGQIAGSALMGASAAGSAYQEKLNEGYDKNQARSYGILVGASEIVMEKVLGGITKLGGGMISRSVLKNLSAVDNVLTRFAKSMGGQILMGAGSEALEEGVQSVLEPFILQAVTGEEASIDWQEAMYSALLGFATGGMFEGADVVYNTGVQNREAKQQYGASQQELVGEALEIDPENAFAQKMQGRLNRGSDLTGGQLNRLVEQNEAAMTAQDKAAIQKAAAQRLTELGETKNVEAIAAALTKQAAGEELSMREQVQLRESKYGQRVANELNPENISSGKYASVWAENLNTDRINPEEYGRMAETAQQPQTATGTKTVETVTQAAKSSQAAKTEPVATVQENRTVAKSATTHQESLQVAKEPAATESEPISLEAAAQKYGAQAGAMMRTYNAGQDVEQFDRAYQLAYDMGRSGVNLDYAMKSEALRYLTEDQREIAYNTGRDAASTKAAAKDAANREAANGKTGRKQGGVVRGEGVTTADLKKAFNDTRGKAYKSLSTIAKVTGINIVLYKSQTDAEGNFVGEQGKFDPNKPNEIWIDINAGLQNVNDVNQLQKYVLLRTFSHEFTHFIEKWNPIRYNEFRRAVFDTMTKQGLDVNDLIESRMNKDGLDYEAASREVVADAMADVLPDANFVQMLAEKHQTVFQKLREKLKEFAQNIKEYFDSVGWENNPAAEGLKEQGKYLDSIVKLWDEIAVEAVETYQQTVATEKVAVSKNETTTTVSETTVETKVEEIETKSTERPAETKAYLEVQKQLAAEHFEQAEKLKQKRTRYNEVMDILNPPKEEQSLDTDGGDAVQYQQRTYPGKDIQDDINYPKNSRDAHAFIREFANKTNGMENSQSKNVRITTADHVYFVRATGYLKGDIESVFTISGNEQLISDAWREFDNGTNRSREAIDSWRKDNRSRSERLSGNTASIEETRTARRIAQLDGRVYGGSDSFGSDWESLGYNSWEEVIEAIENGAMIPDENGDLIVLEQYQQRTQALTDREVLQQAADQLAASDLTDGERDALNIFKSRLEKLEQLQDERTKQGELYRQQQFTAPADRKAAQQTKNRMEELDRQIKNAEADVLAVEDKQVLKAVLQKARKVVAKEQWTKDQESLKRWRERRHNADAIKKYRTRLKKDVDEMTNWVLHPNNKDVVKQIPDVLKGAVIPFLSSVDFTSKRQLRGGEATKADQNFMNRLKGLKAALKPDGADPEKLYSDYNDLPPNFMETLETLIESAQAIVDKKTGEFVVNEMTAEELKALSDVVRNLKTFVQNFNRFHYNAMFKHVSEAGNNSISTLSQMKPAEHTGGVSKFLLWDQMRPAYAFERFGEGGVAVYDGLRRGQAQLAFNTKRIVEFAEKAYTSKEVQAWEKEIKTIELEDGSMVRMPVSNIMSFYELMKRPQALGHILGGGIRVATFARNGKKISDGGHKLTVEDLKTITDQLTDRQKEVADNLQKFMQDQGGKWGNYVSVKRFGVELFGEDHYFPINSDGRYLAANADEKPGNASLYALLNMGFTKALTKEANNQIVLYSIFDVFSSHMASMAQYNAFALPVVDAIKWFNYQQKSEPDENGKREVLASVRDLMDKAYGVPEETRPGSGKRGYAQNFVINIIKAFNGTEAQGTAYDSMGMKTLHTYNRAQVAYNFRVVVQQPLAITRAAQLIDYASIMRGMKLQPAAIQKNIEEMRQYSGIAAWKSLGFYDVNISRGLTSLIKHDDTWQDKVIDIGMKGAEMADTMTWAGMWAACKEEVIRKQKLTPKDAGFYEAVTKLFEDVIYKTQVVDSVLTKNEFMRDKGFFARAVGSFMSEPTTTASMVVDAFDKMNRDMQRGMSRQQAWKQNRDNIVRTVYVYSIGAVVLAAVQAIADAWRDDDDYQTFVEKWLEAFGGNVVDELMILNKLPIVSDFYEVAKELLSKMGFDTYGNPPQSVFMQWYDSLVKGTEILYDRITGAETNYTWYGGAYKLLQALSGITGLPMAGVTREIVTAWNNTVGAMAPLLKVKTYEPSAKSQIKYAYQDGYLTEEEATAQLLEQNLVDSENEAYFTIRGWDAGNGYSRYDAIYDAVLTDGDFNQAMGELTSHGYTKKEVLSEVKSQIGKWYREGNITKQQATQMLTKYFDLDNKEITATVNKWSSVVVTGIAFNDIKDEFMMGNLTQAKAIDMYVRYGGYEQEKAAKTVKGWQFELTYGFAYEDRVDAYKRGLVSATNLRQALIQYGGLSEEDADNNMRAYEWMKKNSKYDLPVTTILQMMEPIEKLGYSLDDVGMDPNAFQNYLNLRKKCEGTDSNNDGKADRNSVKRQVIEVIDDLPITASQKDALYMKNGWSKGGLANTPWH